MGSRSWAAPSRLSPSPDEKKSSMDFGIAPEAVAWMVTVEPRATLSPLGATSIEVWEGGRSFRGLSHRPNVSPTRDGLNRVMTRTGMVTIPSSRPSTFTWRAVISSSRRSERSSRCVTRRRARTMAAEMAPGLFSSAT